MKWTREQTIIALYAYCIIPFNKATNSNPTIISLAPKIGRSITSLKMKIGNFGSLDPKMAQKGIVGLGNSSRLDKEIWQEFNNNWDKLFIEAQRILSSKDDFCLLHTIPQGLDKLTQAKRRINQDFFRSMVLSSYENGCCVSGTKSIELLEAAHIIPWSEDEHLRTNPTNGLCLNSFFHQAYDNNLISISPDYKIVISERLITDTVRDDSKKYLINLSGKNIYLPFKFYPNPDYLAVRYEIFKSTI